MRRIARLALFLILPLSLGLAAARPSISLTLRHTFGAGELPGIVEQRHGGAAAIHPYENVLLLYNPYGGLTYWDIESGALLERVPLPAEEEQVYRVRFSRDGEYLLAEDSDGFAAVDLRWQRPLRLVTFDNGEYAAALVTDTLAIIENSDEDRVEFFDVQEQAFIAMFPLRDYVNSVSPPALSPDGRVLALTGMNVANSRYEIVLRDMTTHEIHRIATDIRPFSGGAFSADGGYWYAVSSFDDEHRLAVYDTHHDDADRLQWQPSLSLLVRGCFGKAHAAFSADSALLAAQIGASLIVYRSDTWLPLAALDTGCEQVLWLGFTVDGRFLVVVLTDGTTSVYDVIRG